MAEKGFDWVSPPTPPENASRRPLNDRRYGVRDPSDARRYGFAPAPDPVSEELAAFQAEQGADMTDAEEQAVFGGDGSEGCFGVSDQALNGGESVDSTVIQDLASEAYAVARSSEDVVAATERWRECMEARGYAAAPTVAEFEGDPSWSERSKPTAEEVQAALADVECKNEAQYVDTFYEAEWREQLSLIEDNSEAFDTYRGKLDRLLERAADIVEKG
jgi:hypothetical protein